MRRAAVRLKDGITTLIVIGYILGATGSFNGALVFVGLCALVAAGGSGRLFCVCVPSVAGRLPE